MSNNLSAQKLTPAISPGLGKEDTLSSANSMEAVVVSKEKQSAGNRFIAPSRSDVSILKLLSDVDDIIDKCRRGPLGLMVGFQEDLFHTTMLKIRANLPEEMKMAARLAREQEELLLETRSSSIRLHEEAKKSAEEALQAAMNEASLKAKQTIEEAQKQAAQLLEEAKKTASRMVQESEIVQQAIVVARETAKRTEEESRNTRKGADAYASAVLTNLDDVLSKALSQVQRGREML